MFAKSDYGLVRIINHDFSCGDSVRTNAKGIKRIFFNEWVILRGANEHKIVRLQHPSIDFVRGKNFYRNPKPLAAIKVRVGADYLGRMARSLFQIGLQRFGNRFQF